MTAVATSAKAPGDAHRLLPAVGLATWRGRQRVRVPPAEPVGAAGRRAT